MEDQVDSEHAIPQISFKKRSVKAKANVRKRPEAPPPASDSASSSGFTSSDDDDEQGGRRVKRRRWGNAAAVTASSAAAAGAKATRKKDEGEEQHHEASSLPLKPSNDATKQSNWYDEEEEEEELNEKNLLGTTRRQQATAAASAPDDGTYKGAANYQSFIKKNPNAPTKKQFGPTKAPTNVRTITMMDFKPDVCKDYKLTGYCGFGDSCIFLHSREDYKQGWELDRDWEIGTQGKQVNGRIMSHRKGGAGGHVNDNNRDDDDEEDELLESIPFACIICKKPYRNPVVTKCGHYFCESCALQRYRKNPSCAACGAGTGGVFNTAKKLNELLDKKRERARKRRERAVAEGEEVSSEEEEEEEEEGQSG